MVVSFIKLVLPFLRRCVFLAVFIFFIFPQPAFDEQPPFIKDNLISFHEIQEVQQKKLLFLQFMKPIIELEDERITKQRQRILVLYHDFQLERALKPKDRKWLEEIGDEYDVEDLTPSDYEFWLLLFKRVDIIPVNLALAQSASESAWGSSRFAQNGNSLFGQWTYIQPTGMIPRKRKPGAKHKVARYETVRDSVRSYMLNLNTHPAYQNFREMRLEQRLSGKPLDGYKLADGLVKYSQRRKAYIKEIREIMKNNDTIIDL